MYPAADNVIGHFTFNNGIEGVGNWYFSVDKEAIKDELTVIGSKGNLRIPFFGKPEIILEKSGQKGKEKFTFELPKHIQQPLIQTVVDDLLGKGLCPGTGDSAARTNWVMEEMTKDYYKKNDKY